MNALDFLVDFAALVSTSEASRPGYDGNDVDQSVDLGCRKENSVSEMSVTFSEEPSLINGKQPVDTVQSQCSMAPSLSQQTFSAHVDNLLTSNTQYQGPYEGCFAVSADPYISQSFDQFLHQHPGPGLPCATINDMNYLACDCERLAHWDPSYDMNYTLPGEPAPWIHDQPQSCPLNHEMRFLETQLVLPAEKLPMQPSQCMDATCHCRYPLPHHQVLGNEYTPAFIGNVWGLHTSVDDRKISKEDDKWLWMSARSQPDMSLL